MPITEYFVNASGGGSNSGLDTVGLSLSGASYNASTGTITGTFSYTYHVGDYICVSSATNGTTNALYLVGAGSTNNSIVLGAQVTGNGATALTVNCTDLRSANGPLSWAAMMSAVGSGTASASSRYNIYGSVSRTTTSDSIGMSGTVSIVLAFRGWSGPQSSGTHYFGDGYQGRVSGNPSLPLVTTNMPAISYTTGGLTISGSWAVVEALNLTSTKTTATLTLSSSYCLAKSCVVENTATSAPNAQAISLSSTDIAYDCDVKVSGSGSGTGTIGCISIGTYSKCERCRISGAGSSAKGVYYSATANAEIIGNLIFGCGSHGIMTGAYFGGHIANNTIYDNGGDGINVATGNAYPGLIENNLITDNSGYGINLVSTSNVAVLVNNRMDRNTSGALGNVGDWITACNYSPNTTHVSAASSEYVSPSTTWATADFGLLPTSPAWDAGNAPSADIGALKHASAVLPNAVDVYALWNGGAGTYGYAVSPLTGTLRGSTLNSADNYPGGAVALTAGILENGQTVDNVSGNYMGVYTYGDTNPAKVLTTAAGAGTYQPVAASAVQKGVAVGVSPAVGTLVGVVDSSGTLHASGICDSSQAWAATGIVDGSAAKHATGIWDGTNYHATTGLALSSVLASAGTYYDGNGSQTGTCAFNTVTSNYTDPGAANVATGNNYTYAGVAQTASYPTTATSQAAQLATDKAAVSAAVASILSTATILSQTGTYVAPTAAQVESGVYFGPGSSYLGTYAGGGSGTYPAAAYVHADAGPYGPSGNDYTPALSALANWCTIAGITWPSPLQVDGGVFYGPVTGTEYEGTGVNASTITAAIQTALTTIGLVQSQATNGGLLVLITGDDYTIATNRPETWSGNAWANLSGATISLVIKEASTGTVAATIAGTVVTAGTGTQTVQVQVPNAITGTLTPGGPGVYRYKVIATWPGPIVQTLALGPVSVMD
jgi:hypothetical protein